VEKHLAEGSDIQSRRDLRTKSTKEKARTAAGTLLMGEEIHHDVRETITNQGKRP